MDKYAKWWYVTEGCRLYSRWPRLPTITVATVGRGIQADWCIHCKDVGGFFGTRTPDGTFLLGFTYTQGLVSRLRDLLGAPYN